MFEDTVGKTLCVTGSLRTIESQTAISFVVTAAVCTALSVRLLGLLSAKPVSYMPKKLKRDLPKQAEGMTKHITVR